MVNKNPRLWHIIFALITFVWLIVTTFSAFFFTRFVPPDFILQTLSFSFHPRWSTITIAPVLLLQIYWVRTLTGSDPEVRNKSARRYLIAFMLIAALLTGLSTDMGFLPFFFHQVAVWPLSLYMIWDFILNLRGR